MIRFSTVINSKSPIYCMINSDKLKKPPLLIRVNLYDVNQFAQKNLKIVFLKNALKLYHCILNIHLSFASKYSSTIISLIRKNSQGIEILFSTKNSFTFYNITQIHTRNLGNSKKKFMLIDVND